MRAAIIGFGDLGRQLKEMIEQQYAPSHFIVFDDGPKLEGVEWHSFNHFRNTEFRACSFFLGLGYKHLRTKYEILNELLMQGSHLPNLVHESCFISKQANVTTACYIYPMCNIDSKSVLKPGALLNNSVTLSHNSTVGSCSYLSPGTIVSGNVSIGDRVFVGSGSVFSNNITLGDDCIVGVGTCVSKSVPPGSNVIGNPMTFKDNISLV
jgi:sugar O-acyltransferase (sialic acid O-acetyltransferase NeuD family)